jgi:hypothetical protein
VENVERESAHQEPDYLPPKIVDAKDELNFAEFPLAAISDRLQPDQKTLVFEDKIYDVSRKEMISRQLTITASDQYGLPTAHDDEVILGLIQLSKIKKFSDRKVNFTRYQLLKLLGWRDEGKSYDRLEKSLNRWIGVTLYYKNAWWNREEECWVDEKFHILEHIQLYDRERIRKARNSAQTPLELSSFTWNEVIFKSFKAGNLKSIDFDFLKSLDGSVTKRLYRFLDKRFFHRKRWEFNLKEVSWEHIGLSRNYDAANIKRKLMPAIRELEEKRFLKRMPESERFVKISSGEWLVRFESSSSEGQSKLSSCEQDKQTLLQALVERGITPTSAAHLVRAYSEEKIKTHLEVFDWMLTQNDPKVSRNPAGFLVASIKEEYAPPKGFLTKDEKEKREKISQERKSKDERRKAAALAREEDKARARKGMIETFWKNISADERRRLEAEALSEATAVQRQTIDRGGAFAATIRKSIFDAYALKLMEQAS